MTGEEEDFSKKKDQHCSENKSAEGIVIVNQYFCLT